MLTSSIPFVSILIPVFNNRNNLARTLQSLSSQTFSSSNFDVVVIDNGSNDNPRDVAEHFGVKFIQEHKNLQSPYSARNRGIEEAQGEIIVLLDTTCVVIPTWIESGVKAIQDGSDLVGGEVVFDIDESSTLGEIYDSLINIRMKESIMQRGVAKTTNLFVKKAIFEDIGLFPEGVRSGADVSWSARAVKAGYKLSFSEDAKVIMQPRKLSPLIKKQYRVAKGQIAIWYEHGGFWKNFVKKGLLCFLPPNPARFRVLIHETGKKFIKRKQLRLYLIGYLLRLVNGVGLVVGLFRQIGR